MFWGLGFTWFMTNSVSKLTKKCIILIIVLLGCSGSGHRGVATLLHRIIILYYAQSLIRPRGTATIVLVHTKPLSSTSVG